MPVDPDGDPGSGSFGSAPFGPTDELGIIFDAQRSFAVQGASVALGVDGDVANTLTVYELAPGSTTRVAQLASVTMGTGGVAPFDVFDRIYGSGAGGARTFWWFDVPLETTFTAGHRYEVVFSGFTLAGGTPCDNNNWIYGHPLYDNEGRAYGQPYNVSNVLTVVDGSLRGSGATLLPFALIRCADADSDQLTECQEAALGTDPTVPDTDGDGCAEGEEVSPNSRPKPGQDPPGYNPLAWYDFFDVPVPANPDPTPNGPRNKVVNMGDVLATVFYVGTADNGGPNGNGVDYDSLKDGDWNGDTVVDAGDEVGLRYDRSPGPAPNPPWDAGPPNGTIDMSDVLAVLAQVGLDCSGPP